MKRIPFANWILLLWTLVLCMAVAHTLINSSKVISPHYETMNQASLLAKEAMDAVKNRKAELGLAADPAADKLQTGMIGERYTSITTTTGILEAKRTTTNPNWAAVLVGMYVRAGLKEGDSIGMICSGSFPAMNLCAMAAAQAYGLNVCLMASVGASSYGANQPQFTFFDMAEYLYEQKILSVRIDYVSFGGSSDVGTEFTETDKRSIYARILQSGIPFLYKSDFEENVQMRIGYFQQEVPEMKFLLNVGGSMVGLGSGISAILDTGYIEPSHYLSGSAPSLPDGEKEGMGLLEYYHRQGIPVANILNIKGLALEYGIPYDPDTMPEIGKGDAYYTVSYSLTIPVIAILSSLAVLIFLLMYTKKYGTYGEKYERNYILCRR